MGRNKKSLSQQTGVISNANRERRERAEENLRGKNRDDLYNVNPRLFYNKEAKNEYFRVISVLLDIDDFISNADYTNLILYSNAFGQYCECLKQVKSEGLVVEETNGNGLPSKKVNQHEKLLIDLQKEMRVFSKELGFALTSRLNLAEKQVDEEQENITKLFGDI